MCIWLFDGKALIVVKCLGVMIDSSLSWSDHVSCLRKKCFGVLASLRRFREVLPAKVKLQLYYAYIVPHLNYCSVVWQECSKNATGH